MSSKISRSSYSEMYGPTTGDKIRLADTDLFIEVENDFTVYGEEVKFGGGKVISCLLYTSPSPRDATLSRMPSSA